MRTADPIVLAEARAMGKSVRHLPNLHMSSQVESGLRAVAISIADIQRLADIAMYDAKQQGRNRVVLATA